MPTTHGWRDIATNDMLVSSEVIGYLETVMRTYEKFKTGPPHVRNAA